MEQTPGSRLQNLRRMLERSPNDTFLLYGLALEFKKANDPSQAIANLDRVIQIDPGYCYAYFQRGQVYESIGDLDAARQSYREGIAAARNKGDEHARSELEGALGMIE